ncbi:MAG TPA: hypothetical protein DIW52_02815 [Pseudomonas sp.]|jgi:hypothetical protein|nr:hypothetical protein [Pseudomonas sp.]
MGRSFGFLISLHLADHDTPLFSRIGIGSQELGVLALNKACYGEQRARATGDAPGAISPTLDCLAIEALLLRTVRSHSPCMTKC